MRAAFMTGVNAIEVREDARVLDWVRADAELSQLFKPYSLVRTVEGIDILRRTE